MSTIPIIPSRVSLPLLSGAKSLAYIGRGRNFQLRWKSGLDPSEPRNLGSLIQAEYFALARVPVNLCIALGK
jgi:hypothetical protein